MDERATQIAELERRIADLKARLPKHSTPPAMLIELDELEEQLENVRAEGGR
ncbi:MAG: histidine kinase [Anaerolineae bacterium]|nr:histidine kinase [Anaerolineae bacterium]